MRRGKCNDSVCSGASRVSSTSHSIANSNPFRFCASPSLFFSRRTSVGLLSFRAQTKTAQNKFQSSDQNVSQHSKARPIVIMRCGPRACREPALFAASLIIAQHCIPPEMCAGRVVACGRVWIVRDRRLQTSLLSE